MQPLLLLHGAIGASRQLDTLAEQLSANYKVYTLDFSGHGNKPMPEEAYSIELFANDVLRFMKEKHLEKVSIFGYSMGGYVGMHLAKHHSAKISKVITLATKYNWDETIAAKEIQMLNPEKIELKLPAFANALKQRHAPNDWKEVLKKTAEMMVTLGNKNTLVTTDYASIITPVLLLVGDRDKMVSHEETTAVLNVLPDAQMCVLPGTQHPIEQADTELLNFIIRRFLK